MIRLTPPGLERLEQAREFQRHVGGSESNTLVGLSRLGLRTCWLSRLTDNPLGRTIAREIQMHGVDVSDVCWTMNDRVGLYFYEPVVGARSSDIVYDRAGSAFSKFPKSELSVGALQHTRVLHTTGISLALSDAARETMEYARSVAVAGGSRLSFDFNFRSKLWTMAEARKTCESWVQTADLVFMAKRDACGWLELPEDAPDASVLDGLHQLRPCGVTVLTLGSSGAMVRAEDLTLHQPTIPRLPESRLGAGDAFSAGFLYGWLNAWGWERCLNWGNAAAQIKLSIPGDMPWFHAEEVARVADGDATPRLVR